MRRRRKHRGRRNNPKRRLRRRSGWGWSRKRRRGKRRNPRFRYRRRKGGGRRRRFNPSIVQTMSAGFKPAVLTRAAVITGGALGNAALGAAVGRFLPSMLRSGPGSYVVGLGSAGVLGLIVGKVAPRQAGDVFLGGVLEVVTRAVKEYALPLIPGGASLTAGMNDYLTPGGAASAVPLGHMGDYFQPGTPLLPLGDYGSDIVADELAS